MVLPRTIVLFNVDTNQGLLKKEISLSRSPHMNPLDRKYFCKFEHTRRILKAKFYKIRLHQLQLPLLKNIVIETVLNLLCTFISIYILTDLYDTNSASLVNIRYVINHKY